MIFTNAKVQTNRAKFRYICVELNLKIMKKPLYYVLFLIGCFGAYAQQDDDGITKVEIVKDSSDEYADAFGSHEIRLNALDLVLYPTVHLYYERVLDQSNGYGISALANFGDNENTYQNFALTPYYRFYFLNRKDFGASGLFVEVFSSFVSANFHKFKSSSQNKDVFQFSMGIALGKKWVNRNGFSFEAFVGFGRYLNKIDNGADGHGRVGLAIGKRF